METMRLRKIQVPSNVQRLLEAVISKVKLVPENAYLIRDPKSLPMLLRELAELARRKDAVWSAWSDDHLIWLFTAEMSLALSRERGSPVLHITAYTEDGQLKEAGFWTPDKLGRWGRCAD
jgi:hypothetical protein